MFAAPQLVSTSVDIKTEQGANTCADLEALVAEVDASINVRPALRLAVMEVQRYDETLVILANGLISPAFIRLALEPIWPGPIEVYDAGSMFGSAANG